MTHRQPSGVLVIDKPAGWTSHDVVAKTRGLTRIRKIGHSGTLDPMATGVLVLCLGQATRLLEYLAGLPKVYQATIALGVATDTYDATGRVTAERAIPDLAREAVDSALNAFRGAIMQTPPAYSAIKRNGVPQYDRARRGEEVTLEPRPVIIYELAVLQVSSGAIDVRVACSAGTYIRSLAHDLGATLGCGAHLSELRRLAVGPFAIDQAITLADLADPNWQRWMQPPGSAVAHLPQIEVTAAEAGRLMLGQAIAPQNQAPVDLAGAFDPFGTLIGIVKFDPQRQVWRPVKVLATTDE